MHKKYFLSVAVLAVILGGIAAYIARPHTAYAPAFVQTAATTSAPAAAVKQTPVRKTATTIPIETATVSVNGTVYMTPLAANETVFDVMSSLSRTTDFSFTYTTYAGLGAFVESINGKQNGGGFTWFFYVNGVESPVGISTATLKSGDAVSWKFEKNN